MIPIPMKYLLLCWLTGFQLLFAQEKIHYDITFPNAVHHEAEISVTYREVPEGPLQLRMSVSSPGRYAIHQFGKNVSQVRAWDREDHALEIVRTAPEMWEVKQHKGQVRVSYTLFANWTDGTYSEIDESHAHLNMPATFLWARGLEESPISITFHLPQGSDWQVATQLMPIRKPNTYTARNLPYFLDSPTELSAHTLREWTVKDATGKSAGFRLAVHHDGDASAVDALEAATQKTVDEVIAIFGEMPDFDNGTYTFLIDYLPGNDGDGMEHRNSTIITSGPSPDGLKQDMISTVSHEFIHAWNVERIRPRSLEPFDFERANMSGELWFAEGFTSYYAPLALARAGIYDLATFGAKLNGSLNYVLNSPGARSDSPVEMSKMAAFTDAATAVDPTAFHNTFTSYYPYGAVTGLALDLEIRNNYPGLSLDDFMQEVWRRFGKTERPYNNRDLVATLAEVLNDKAFAESFFESFVFGHERPDYASLLARAGLRLRKAHPGKASLGPEGISFAEGVATITYGTMKGSPLYEAGLEREDVLLSLAGRTLKNEKALEKALKKRPPGETVPISYQRRGQTRSASLTLTEDPAWEIVPFEAAGEAVTDDIRTFRASWLESKGN